jgi:hypothetical protein
VPGGSGFTRRSTEAPGTESVPEKPIAPRGRVGLSTLSPVATAGDAELMRVNRSGCPMLVVQMAQSFHYPLRWVEPTSAARRSLQAQRARSYRHERSGS